MKIISLISILSLGLNASALSSKDVDDWERAEPITLAEAEGLYINSDFNPDTSFGETDVAYGMILRVPDDFFPMGRFLVGVSVYPNTDSTEFDSEEDLASLIYLMADPEMGSTRLFQDPGLENGVLTVKEKLQVRSGRVSLTTKQVYKLKVLDDELLVMVYKQKLFSKKPLLMKRFKSIESFY